MAKCMKCDKTPMFGSNRPWSKKRTNRRFNVNMQKVTVFEGGRKQQLTLCSRCLRTMAKA